MMPPERPNFLPDPRFVPLRPALQEHLGKIAQSITPGNFAGLCDGMILGVIQEAIRGAGADEGSIWIVDPARENLVVAWNSGPRADEITGFRQPLSSGIVSMVLANEQAFVESEVYKNAGHSGLLDGKLDTVTYAMIAVPFHFLNACRGVISCVQFIEVEMKNNLLTEARQRPRGFGMEELGKIQWAAAIAADLIDHRLLKGAVGWNR